VTREAYEGFSIALPAGWSDVLDEATYSDPDQLPPTTFSGQAGIGTLHVAVPLFEDAPGAHPDVVHSMVLEWGRRRGRPQPLSTSKDSDARGGSATATYRIADDFVQIWFLSNGRAVIQVSYVCPWESREIEREARDAVVASLRFG
jgi:hypothetical protein